MGKSDSDDDGLLVAFPGEGEEEDNEQTGNDSAPLLHIMDLEPRQEDGDKGNSAKRVRLNSYFHRNLAD